MAEPAQVIQFPQKESATPPAQAGVADVLDLMVLERARAFDAIVTEWARTKVQRLDIMNYNGAQMANIHANDIAKKLGLNPQGIGVTPFPCPSVQHISMEQRAPSETEQAPAAPAKPPAAPPAQSGGIPGWLKALLAAGLGAGLTAGAIWLAQNSSILKIGNGGAGPDDSSYDVLFYDKDGNPISVPRVKLKDVQK